MSSGIPNDAEGQKYDRMQHEERGVQPGFQRLAQARMHELVLGDEQARERAQRHVNTESVRSARRHQDEPAVAEHRRQGV